ncbi:hypothetical protein N431DRAFT_312523, partial [Stipitochalara longipes BDJ]
KKHTCRVCEKRFVRPSALQIHIYSHTGEKNESYLTFQCEVEECGKYFSVSNLRRHKRMHRR